MLEIQQTPETVIPKEVMMVLAVLQGASFEAFLVGGCVRDLVMGVKPKDYDVTTNATPEQIIALFPKTFYENTYGTVGIVTCGEEGLPVCSDETIKIIEVTPYRVEAGYSDGRHPDQVSWSAHIEDDLKRRDFTCNAMAYNPVTQEFIDLFGGKEDIQHKRLKAVGDADTRFKEDGLRLMRAIRFVSQLDFDLDSVTRESIEKNSLLLNAISRERVRDELVKLLSTDYPMRGLVLMKETGLLQLSLSFFVGWGFRRIKHTLSMSGNIILEHFSILLIRNGRYTYDCQPFFMIFRSLRHVVSQRRKGIIRFMGMMLLVDALHVK